MIPIIEETSSAKPLVEAAAMSQIFFFEQQDLFICPKKKGSAHIFLTRSATAVLVQAAAAPEAGAGCPDEVGDL